MIFLLAIWTSFDLALDIESAFFKMQSALKRDFQPNDFHKPVPSLNDALLIDVSDDRISLYDTFQDNHVLATDRLLLDRLFRNLHTADNYKYIVCDLYFDIPSKEDDRLFKTLSKLRHIVFPKNADGGTTDLKHSEFIQKHSGYTSYNYIKWINLSDDFLKFRLINERGEESLPLIVYQDLTGEQLISYGQLLEFSGKKILTNNITIDAHITNKDLKDASQVSPVYRLRDFLTLLEYSDQKEKNALTNNKIILIGDFQNDMHSTAYGEMSGVLTLYNLIISLLNHDNEITISWLLFILSMFTLISYITYYVYSEVFRKVEYFLKKLLGIVFGSVTLNAVGIGLVSLFSYFLFDKTIEVIALSLWLSFIEFILQKYRNHDGYFLLRKKTPVNYVKFIMNLE